MTVPARINLVTLGAEDLARARAFYAALGWRDAMPGLEEVAFFDLNGVVLSLYARTALAHDMRVADAPAPGFRGVALAINVETPEDVASVLDEAAAAGGRILAPAVQMDWGGVAGYFADPEGHAWEVAYNPGMPLDADGRITLP